MAEKGIGRIERTSIFSFLRIRNKDVTYRLPRLLGLQLVRTPYPGAFRVPRADSVSSLAEAPWKRRPRLCARVFVREIANGNRAANVRYRTDCGPSQGSALGPFLAVMESFP